MKTYTVLYAQDVPHYGTNEIEAASDDEAIALAKTDPSDYTDDPDWNNAVCQRIVHIEGPEGIIAEAIPLDGYTLIHGEDKRLLCDAAEKMLLALERTAKYFRDHVTEDHPLAQEIDAVIAGVRGQQ